MLKDLDVLNGNLELKFNEYTYEYTVTVDSDVDALELFYKLDEHANINIRDNELKTQENIVYLDVYNIDNEVTYTLYVYKKETNLTAGINSYKESLEVKAQEEIDIYKVQILAVSIFLIIIIIFTIMFKKREIKPCNK